MVLQKSHFDLLTSFLIPSGPDLCRFQVPNCFLHLLIAYIYFFCVHFIYYLVVLCFLPYSSMFRIVFLIQLFLASFGVTQLIVFERIQCFLIFVFLLRFYTASPYVLAEIFVDKLLPCLFLTFQQLFLECLFGLSVFIQLYNSKHIVSRSSLAFSTCLKLSLHFFQFFVLKVSFFFFVFLFLGVAFSMALRETSSSDPTSFSKSHLSTTCDGIRCFSILLKSHLFTLYIRFSLSPSPSIFSYITSPDPKADSGVRTCCIFIKSLNFYIVTKVSLIIVTSILPSAPALPLHVLQW